MESNKNTTKNIIQISLLFITSIIILMSSIFTIKVYTEEVDTIPPVIDNIVFAQHGETLNNGDTFLIEIYAHDDESGIKSIDIFTGSEGQAVGAGKSCVYNEEKNCYIFSEIIHDSYTDNIYISSITVTDNAENVTKLDVNENTLTKNQYCAKINPLSPLNLDIDFVFEKNGKTVNDISDLGISIETKDTIPSNSIQLIFNDKADTYHRLVLWLDKSDSSSKLYNSNIRYAWESTEEDANNEGEWVLERITALIGFPLNEPTFNVNAANYSFTLDKNYVKPEPVSQATIKSLHLDKNTEDVEIGENINITVDIDTSKNMSSTGQLILHADNIESNTKTIDLLYDNVEKKYHGVFNAEEGIDICKWYIEKINICDEEGNYVDDSLFIDSTDHPYFINIIKKDIAKVHKVKLDFYQMNLINSWVKTKTISTEINNGKTLKDVGIEFPTRNTTNPIYRIIGWKDQNGNEVTENFKITSDTNLSLYAIYDEKKINFVDDNFKKVLEIIKKWESEHEYHIEMNETTIIPKQILETAKDKNIKIVFEMNGYQWTIDGKDITSNDLQDINMEVILDTNSIPTNLIQQIAGNNPIKQLTLKHNGNFGFKAMLTINIGSQYAGQFGNLFWHNNRNLIYMNSGKISMNGEINLNFNHASDYVIVMSNKDMDANSNNNDNINGSYNTNNSSTNNNKNNSISKKTNTNTQTELETSNQISKNNSSQKAPATGDGYIFIIPILSIVFSIMIVLYITKNKNINKL